MNEIIPCKHTLAWLLWLRNSFRSLSESLQGTVVRPEADSIVISADPENEVDEIFEGNNAVELKIREVNTP